jgi:hypothetical protein
VPTAAEELIRAFGDVRLREVWERARAEQPGSEYERLLYAELERRGLA